MAQPTPQQVEDIIEGNIARYVEHLRILVQAYPGGEEQLQRLMSESLKEIGCTVQTLRLMPTNVQLNREFALPEAIDLTERIHVIGKLAGKGGGRSIMLIVHPDADPVNTVGWSKPPHAGHVEGGRMYGWAVADDLAGAAIMVAAAQALNRAGFTPRGDIYLMSASSKRNAWGIAALLREGYRADAALYVHPAESELGLKEIKTLTSGLLKFRIRVRGRKPDRTEFVQVTFHHLGVNPIDKAIYLIESLKLLDEERRATTNYGPLADSVGRGTNLLVTHVEAGRRDNLTDVPAECTVGFGLTFPPTEDIDDVVGQVERAIREASESDTHLREYPPEVTWVQGTQGVEVPMDHPIVQTTMRAVEAVTGERPFSNPLYSKSDVRTPVLIAGIPNVGLGPLAGGLATTGGVDEWVDIREYVDTIKVCARIIMDWCG
ncbi:MAG: M20/M25/M40 family metallo-hydrolase [Candidatus Bathyarchaeota archaeon]